MADTITFETVRPRPSGEPGNCDLCNSRSALLHYLVQGDDGISEALHGHCCSACAVKLVEALALRQVAGLAKAIHAEALAALEA